MRTHILLAVALSIFIVSEGYGQQAKVMSPETIAGTIRKLPKKPPTNAEVITEDHYAVKVATLVHRVGPGELHETEDRVFYLLDGSGSICIGGKLMSARTVAQHEQLGNSLAGCHVSNLAPGTVVSIPRGTPYQLRAASTRIVFLVVRIEGK